MKWKHVRTTKELEASAQYLILWSDADEMLETK